MSGLGLSGTSGATESGSSNSRTSNGTGAAGSGIAGSAESGDDLGRPAGRSGSGLSEAGAIDGGASGASPANSGSDSAGMGSSTAPAAGGPANSSPSKGPGMSGTGASSTDEFGSGASTTGGVGDAGLQPPDWLTSSGGGLGYSSTSAASSLPSSGSAPGSSTGSGAGSSTRSGAGTGGTGDASGPGGSNVPSSGAGPPGPTTGATAGSTTGPTAGAGGSGGSSTTGGTGTPGGSPNAASPGRGQQGGSRPPEGTTPGGPAPAAYPPAASTPPQSNRPEQPHAAATEDSAGGRRAGRSDAGGAPRQRRKSSREVAEEREDHLFDGLIDTRKPIPQSGLQAWLYRLTRINLGPSKRDTEEAEVRKRLNRQLRRTRGYCGYIGIASEKGGVGKTTLAALLAAEISEGRRESVGVADLNPDLGTLPDRYGLRPHYSIRDLLAHVDEIPWRYHVHDFMEKVPEMNVRVLAASTDRKIRHQVSRSDVELLSELFAPFFSFAILDNGTHITHEAMLGTLKVAHGLVLVTDNTRDGANLARKTLQFLTDNGFPDIRRRVILAVIAKETASPVKTRAIERAFKDHVRELVIVPYDPSLDGGGPIAFRDPNAMNKLLRPQTRSAVRRLAAFVIDDLVT